ncbi:MAG: Holliday junction resolvase RuvX [Bacteroidota bacterium]
MGRILALDYGSKRTGIAVTDPLKMIANPLETIETSQLIPFLTTYCEQEEVEIIVVGFPKDLMNRSTHGTEGAQRILDTLNKRFPSIQLRPVDERFTSKMAFDTMLSAGLSKKKRSNKELVDKLSATIILQSFLEQAGT